MCLAAKTQLEADIGKLSATSKAADTYRPLHDQIEAALQQVTDIKGRRSAAAAAAPTADTSDPAGSADTADPDEFRGGGMSRLDQLLRERPVDPSIFRF